MSLFKHNEVRKTAKEQEEKVDYEINCPTPSDYDLKLKMKADAKLLKIIWDKSKVEILRKRGLDVRTSNPEKIQEFEAPASYHKFIKVTIRKIWANCARDFKKDGVVLLDYYVNRTVFKLNKAGGWDITIYVKGVYTKE